MIGKNKVILMGSDHHNGLGLVRSFGVNGVNPIGIIICENTKKSFVCKSRYWEEVWCVKDEVEAIELLIRKYSDEKLKPVIIPWSDKMASVIDNNVNKLKLNFIIPSIGGQEGAICDLMDKQKQVEFCKVNGLNVLDSSIYVLEEGIALLDNINYPVILKPVASVEGEKLDIKVCFSREELENSFDLFKQKNYSRVLVQRYLQERIEYVLTGAVAKNFISYTIVSHNRQWPNKTGSGSFSIFEVDELVKKYAEHCLEVIIEKGYEGTIDIEFFKDNQDNFYLNEINWRSSGRNFVSLYTEVYSAYQYYNKITGKRVESKLINEKQGYSMNEATDLRHVLCGRLGCVQWLKDLMKTGSYALWYKKDIKPTVFRYCYLVKELISRKKILKL